MKRGESSKAPAPRVTLRGEGMGRERGTDKLGQDNTVRGERNPGKQDVAEAKEESFLRERPIIVAVNMCQGECGWG